MSTSTTYSLDSLAYALPILHAARYPSYTVLGLFLGSLDPSGDVIVEDAVPLLHHYTSLTPMAEAGLSLVRAAAKSRSLSLVGLYVIYDGEVTGLGRVGERVLQELKKDFEGAIGFTVDNSRLGKGDFPYTLYPASNPTKPLSTTPSGMPSNVKMSSDAAIKSTLSLIRTNKAHQLVVDFDDQLEDPEADWLGNAKAKSALKNGLGQ